MKNQNTTNNILRADYIGNAFSLQMLQGDADIQVRTVSVEEAKALVSEETVSCVGHADTAAVFGDQLGHSVACNRMNVTLNKGDILLVGQLTGGRLPEGATTLPEGFGLKWCVVTIG